MEVDNGEAHGTYLMPSLYNKSEGLVHKSLRNKNNSQLRNFSNIKISTKEKFKVENKLVETENLNPRGKSQKQSNNRK